MMPARYELPKPEDFVRLSQRHDYAVTIYAETSPVVGEREASFTRVKSAYDASVEDIKRAGASFAVREWFRTQWEEIAADDELWGNLTASLALFVAPDGVEIFALPNRLETQRQVASYFDLGQLFRSITFPQRAFALLVSANEWSLWLATDTERATRLDVADHHPADVSEATHRGPDGGADNVRRLIGEEGKKVLLDAYAKRVSDAVVAELKQRGEDSRQIVFVFAAEPLLSMLTARGLGVWRVLPVPGAPDRLESADIDRALRERLAQLNAAEVQRRVEEIADEVSSGRVETQLAVIARAAAESAVDTLVFDFGVDVFGTLDPDSGEIALAPAGERMMADGSEAYDLLSAVAVTVAGRGGTVLAVREGEVTSPLWNGESLARLRYPLRRTTDAGG
jgi:hypothetical protein